MPRVNSYKVCFIDDVIYVQVQTNESSALYFHSSQRVLSVNSVEVIVNCT